MEIKNFKQSPCPVVPKELEGKIKFTTDCVLPERDLYLFNLVLNNLIKQMKEEKFIFSKVQKVTVVFSEKTDFGLFFESSEKATYTKLIVYPVIDWKERDLNENVKIMSFTEELCHHFWRVDDEQQVNYPVFRILNRILEGGDFEEKISDLMRKEIEEPKDFAHF